MSLDLSVALVGLGGGAAAASYASQMVARYLLKKENESTETIDAKIQRLSSSLLNASRAIGEIEAEISSRKALVDDLREDAEKHKAILELKPEQVKAISSTLTEGIRVQNSRSFWIGVGINFLLFLAGAAASYAFTTMS